MEKNSIDKVDMQKRKGNLTNHIAKNIKYSKNTNVRGSSAAEKDERTQKRQEESHASTGGVTDDSKPIQLR